MSEKIIPIRVSKESIADLVFPIEDVLKSEDEKNVIKRELERATTLGNVEHNKTKIIFEDNGGIKQVETTIWATTDKRIVLKGGVVIPINRILQVKHI
jgi:ribosome-interacting GTPase 1